MSEHEISGFVDELLERSATVTSLGVAELGAFVSSLLDITEREQATDALLERIGSHHERGVATAVVTGIAALADQPAAERAMVIADSLGVSSDAARSVSAARLTRGWLVTAPFGRSLVTSWALTDAEASDGHGVLFEIDDHGSLVDLVLLENPGEMVSEIETGGELDVAALSPDQAARRAVEAWQSGLGSAEMLGPNLAANQRLVRRWLEAATGIELGLYQDRGETADPTRGMTPEEIADANAAALSTLRSAIGDAPSDESDPAWISCVQASIPDLTERQRQGLLWLEWADWLGVGIGLLRSGVGSSVTGESLVDLVNRCPEVSSTIERDDREYATWAFEIAIDHLADAGVVEAGALTERGWLTLHGSLVEAWSPDQ